MDTLQSETRTLNEAADPAERATRAEQLLEHLRRVLSHDLPNQLVAVRGLLQLQLEERSRSGGDSLEYVERAVAATQRAQATVLALKELAQLGCVKETPEGVSLDELAREIAAEVKILHPACTLEWQLERDAVRLAAPRRLLHQGLLRLLRSLLPPGRPAPVRLEIHSRRTAAAVELSVADFPHEVREDRPRQPSAAAARDESLDRILAEEFLAACGGGLCVRPEPGRGTVFTLTLPPG
jgi:signal transduction histidine kinase